MKWLPPSKQRRVTGTIIVIRLFGEDAVIIGRDGRLRHVMDKIKTASHQDDVLTWLRQNPG